MEHLTKKQKMDAPIEEEKPETPKPYDLKQMYHDQCQVTANLFTVLATFNQRIINLENKSV
jgi:hypothetical protein